MKLLNLQKAIAICINDIRPKKKISLKIEECLNRILSDDLVSRKNAPPYDVSAMDGYAINIKSLKYDLNSLKISGVIPAGKKSKRTLQTGEAIRLFTGSELPKGANTVIIQENVKINANKITLNNSAQKFQNIRKKGLDFKLGDTLIKKGTQLKPKHISLSAAMNYRKLSVFEKPSVAIISTGNELVKPETAGAENKIISSNNYGIKTYVEYLGGTAVDLGIARDNIQSLQKKILSANKFDIILTIGGASVGAYDLVKESIKEDLNLKFWKIAMRPGKPLIFGHIENSCFLGLPGNPVSALVCCQLFLKPMINKFMNLADNKEEFIESKILVDLNKNDEREEYLRAVYKDGFVKPNKNQDSSSLNVLSQSNVFIVRKPFDPAKKRGDLVKIIKIDL
ncbi:MAG: molybdopterin molybdotransferase MoeA [Hyphomicrobiales bacterium]|jgi:molybdopterin molybdotransferase|nr:molybdopterin molybdotransferase MoeA [Hyphomicrobiales bacterium]